MSLHAATHIHQQYHNHSSLVVNSDINVYDTHTQTNAFTVHNSQTLISLKPFSWAFITKSTQSQISNGKISNEHSPTYLEFSLKVVQWISSYVQQTSLVQRVRSMNFQSGKLSFGFMNYEINTPNYLNIGFIYYRAQKKKAPIRQKSTAKAEIQTKAHQLTCLLV